MKIKPITFNQLKIAKKLTISQAVITAAVIFFLVELVIILCRYYGYYPSDTAFDQGIFNQVFWNGIHGRFFQSSLSSSLSISEPIPEVSYHRLGQHFTPALLLWLPIYAIFPRAVTLFVLNIALITSAGIVLYILARQRLEPKLATLIAISFYGSKAIMAPTLGNFQDLCQLPLFTFGLFLALEKRCWSWFWLLAVLILAVREDAGILLFSIGGYLLLSRRYPWLGLAVCLVSFSYCLVVTSKVMPLFSHDVSQRFLIDEFGHFVDGDKASSLEVIWGMISKPIRLIIEIISPFKPTFSYLVALFLPLAFISAISGATWLLIAFPLLVLLLRNESWMLSLSMRYVLAIVPGLFYGAILWWSHHPGAWKARFRRFWLICIGVSIFFTFTSNPNQALSFIIPDSIQPWVYASPLQQWQRASIINSYIAQIPPQASASATNQIVTHLSSRREMLRVPRVELINDAGEKILVDYVIADLGQLQQYQIVFADERKRLREIVPVIDELLKQGSYGVIGCQNGVIFLQRGVASEVTALSVWNAFRQEIQFKY
jgi:uncharacterized membrane protein